MPAAGLDLLRRRDRSGAEHGGRQHQRRARDPAAAHRPSPWMPRAPAAIRHAVSPRQAAHRHRGVDERRHDVGTANGGRHARPHPLEPVAPYPATYTAAAGGCLLACPALRAQPPARRSLRAQEPGRRCPTACRSATSWATGRWCGAGADRAGADAGALVDDREHGRDRRCGLGATRSRIATSRPRSTSSGLPAGQRIFYEVELPRPRRPQDRQRAGARQLRHAAGCEAEHPLRLVGRHGGAGLGDQPRPRRHADLRGDAAGRARLLHPFRRHDLRRRADLRRGQASRTARPGSGPTASHGATSPFPRRRRSPRRCASIG